MTNSTETIEKPIDDATFESHTNLDVEVRTVPIEPEMEDLRRKAIMHKSIGKFVGKHVQR